MNPVLSDLSIRVARVEAEQRVAAAHRHHLARQAATGRPTFAGRFGVLLDTIREFVDPRGYAMRRLAAKQVDQPATPMVLETNAAREPAPDAAPSGTLTVIEGRSPVAAAAKTAA